MLNSFSLYKVLNNSLSLLFKLLIFILSSLLIFSFFFNSSITFPYSFFDNDKSLNSILPSNSFAKSLYVIIFLSFAFSIMFLISFSDNFIYSPSFTLYFKLTNLVNATYISEENALFGALGLPSKLHLPVILSIKSPPYGEFPPGPLA